MRDSRTEDDDDMPDALDCRADSVRGEGLRISLPGFGAAQLIAVAKEFDAVKRDAID